MEGRLLDEFWCSMLKAVGEARKKSVGVEKRLDGEMKRKLEGVLGISDEGVKMGEGCFWDTVMDEGLEARGGIGGLGRGMGEIYD